MRIVGGLMIVFLLLTSLSLMLWRLQPDGWPSCQSTVVAMGMSATQRSELIFAEGPEPGSKRWTRQEKLAVQECVDRIAFKFPMLLRKAAGCSSVQLLRCKDDPSDGPHDTLGFTIPLTNRIFLTDAFFARNFDYQLWILVHELVHCVDVGFIYSSDPRWLSLMGTFDRRKKDGYWQGSTWIGKYNDYPTAYAATDPEEALPEFCAAVSQGRSVNLPPEQRAFVNGILYSRDTFRDKLADLVIRSNEARVHSDFERAKRLLDDAISMAPDLSSLYICRLELLRKNSDLAHDLPQLRDANTAIALCRIANAPSNSNGYLSGYRARYRDKLYCEQKDLVGAANALAASSSDLEELEFDAYSRAVDPNYSDEEVLVHLNALQRHAFNDPGILWLRGNLRAAFGDFNKAVDDFSNLENAAVFPDESPIRLARGEALAQMGKLKEADKEFCKCLSLDPGNAWAYKARSMVRHKLGWTALARKDAEHAYSLNSMLFVENHHPTETQRSVTNGDAPLASGRPAYLEWKLEQRIGAQKSHMVVSLAFTGRLIHGELTQNCADGVNHCSGTLRGYVDPSTGCIYLQVRQAEPALDHISVCRALQSLPPAHLRSSSYRLFITESGIRGVGLTRAGKWDAKVQMFQ